MMGHTQISVHSKRYSALKNEIIRLEQRMDEAMDEFNSFREQRDETRKMLRNELNKHKATVKDYREWMR